MSWEESAPCGDGYTEVTERPERPTREEDLEFRLRPKMIRWLSPKELGHTAMRVFLASVFGAYADKREMQAALDGDLPVPDEDGQEQPTEAGGATKPREELWVDFVADLGDAFGPTYAVASLLAQPALDVGVRGRKPHATERGRVLVMGGDQVYPTASVEGYNDRTVGPYRAALPYAVDPPDLYAIPGNHDWYDGLTSFMRVFCTQQWIGGWRTRQRRSYFALQLPHRWWIFGIDIQLESYIDEPQLRYFDEVVGPHMKEGDSVILCSAVPAWVKATREGHEDAFATLDYFERKIVRKRKAEIRLALTGDAHHYARYAEAGGAQKITAGGGGAFLSATHHLPEELHCPPKGSRRRLRAEPVSYTLEAAYPTQEDSRRLRRQVVLLPFKNGSMTALIGGVHLLYAWMIQSVLRDPGQDFSALMPGLSPSELARGVLRSPLAILLSGLVVWGMAGFTKSKRWQKRVMGAVHGLLHVGVAVFTIYGASRLGSWLDLEHGAFLAAFLLLVGAGGGLLGSWLLAGYLLVADRFKCNTNELFAAQRSRLHKNFLRLHVGRDGVLTVYPVKVERPPKHWDLRETPAGQAAGVEQDEPPWFVPRRGESLVAELIEEPIKIAPARRTEPAPERVEVGSGTP